MDSFPYQLLVIDDTTHSLLLVDSPNGEIVTEIPYPPEYTPTELLLAPDKTKAYIPAIGKAGIGALFIANLTERSLYRLPVKIPAPTQCTLNPSGTCLYLSDPNGILHALDIPTLTLKSWDTPESSCIGLAADEHAVYSVSEHKDQGSLALFTPQGQFLREYILTGIPTNITLDDQGHIFIPFTTPHFTIEGVMCFTLTLQDDNTPIVTTTQRCIYPYSTSPSAAYPSHVATYSADNIAYIVNEENASITMMNCQSAVIIRHIELDRSISCLHLLPGGQFAIATSHIFSDLSMIDLHNGRLLSTTNTKRELLGYLAIIPL